MKIVTYFLSTFIALFIVGCTGAQNPQTLADNRNPASVALEVNSQATAVAILSRFFVNRTFDARL